MKIAAIMWIGGRSGVLLTALALSLFVDGGARAQTNPPLQYKIGNYHCWAR